MILIDGRRGEGISPLDRGLAYGDGVFRTMRARHGAVLHWPRHYRKLSQDCRALGIECPADTVLAAEMEEILRVERECVLKIIVTRGAGGRGYGLPGDPRPTRIVASFPLPAPRAGAVEEGVRVRWCSTRLAPQPALAGLKHLNRLENVLARREWSDDAIAEGLMLDVGDHVVEGTMSNLFLLERDRLVTPDLTQCGVAGVQRERLLELAPRLGLSYAVEQVVPSRVLAADQVLLVNSVIGLWRVAALDDRRWARSDFVTDIARVLEQGDD